MTMPCFTVSQECVSCHTNLQINIKSKDLKASVASDIQMGHKNICIHPHDTRTNTPLPHLSPSHTLGCDRQLRVKPTLIRPLNITTITVYYTYILSIIIITCRNIISLKWCKVQHLQELLEPLGSFTGLY